MFADWVLWTITTALLLLGLCGSVVPFLPGNALIFATAVAHHFFGPVGQRVGWWGLGLLLLLLIISAVLDYAATGWSTKRFGGSRWGAAGAIIGTLIGTLFFPLGLVLGPLLGAIAGELVGRRKKIASGELTLSQWQQVGKPAAGSLVGIVLGMAGQLAVGITMIGVFLLDALVV